eukprot:TRINITY_DN1584_c0_g1_i1.p3 TRINITY_DN1584_c0_g1~~TRINITY_DN1584_c0_g1_i1.p3  ORF type:complete len:307 (-),score=65.42 TRINITY_DN1584_c0_g1_i1:51-971(-)
MSYPGYPGSAPYGQAPGYPGAPPPSYAPQPGYPGAPPAGAYPGGTSLAKPGGYPGAPPAPYGAPQPGYPGAPPPAGYGAPAPAYPGYPAPGYPGSPSGYAAPYPTYGAPAAPAPYGYAAPYPTYGAAPVVAAPMMAAPVMAVGVAPVVVGGPSFAFHFRGLRLDRKDILSKSDPFLCILACRNPHQYVGRHTIKANRKETKHSKKFGQPSANWYVMHRTETIMNNQNPVWQPFTLPLASLCQGNIDAPIKIEVWDFDHHSNHDFIGSAVTTLRDLQVCREVRLVNKRRIGIFNTSGVVEVMKCAPC